MKNRSKVGLNLQEVPRKLGWLMVLRRVVRWRRRRLVRRLIYSYAMIMRKK
ncbi:hypothetical protein A2U01_0096631, partial [Trifolium medium]|nr:hypothetical protein [Trifolium medium]